jgi:hypothetical protein
LVSKPRPSWPPHNDRDTTSSRPRRPDCERAYDEWSRGHWADIVWQAFSATIVIALGGLVLPLVGLGPLIAAVGVFAGFGTLYGSHRATRRYRRRQFLQGALPRAYLSK